VQTQLPESGEKHITTVAIDYFLVMMGDKLNYQLANILLLETFSQRHVNFSTKVETAFTRAKKRHQKDT